MENDLITASQNFSIFISSNWISISSTLIAVLFGAIGGVGAAIAARSDDSHYEQNSEKVTFDSAALGSCGGLGFMFFTISIGGLDGFDTHIEVLRLVSTSTLAGFGARNILPKMARSIENSIDDKLREVNEKTDLKIAAAESHSREGDKELKREIQTHSQLIAALQVQNLKNRIRAARKQHSPITNWEDYNVTQEKINKYRDEFYKGNDALPGSWVDLAITFKLSEKLDEAIQILEEYQRRTFNSAIQNDRANLSNSYYNMACYKSINLSEKEFKERNDSEYKEIINLILESHRLRQNSNYQVADLLNEIKSDDDFSKLMEDQTFLNLLEKTKGP
ncbi:hypothetical protein AB1P65_21990 [Roseibium alexandrii]